jgi:translation initiation factor 2B subunit (eIF-2B alpha/beta/delta family)
LKTVPDVAGRIERLEIQGATNIAIQAVKALCQELRDYEGPRKGMVNLLTNAIKILVNSRSTEPMMRNGLRYIETELTTLDPTSRERFKESVNNVEERILSMYTDSRKRIQSRMMI